MGLHEQTVKPGGNLVTAGKPRIFTARQLELFLRDLDNLAKWLKCGHTRQTVASADRLRGEAVTQYNLRHNKPPEISQGWRELCKWLGMATIGDRELGQKTLTAAELSYQISKLTSAFKKSEDAVIKPTVSAAPFEPARPTHNADFTMVDWYGTEYAFSPGLQAGAVKALWQEWEKTGLGLHHETIRDSVDAERDNFRLPHVFRQHPAYGAMILSNGKGLYVLGNGGTKARSPKRKTRAPKPVKPIKPTEARGYNERALRAKRKIEADFADEAAGD